MKVSLENNQIKHKQLYLYSLLFVVIQLVGIPLVTYISVVNTGYQHAMSSLVKIALLSSIIFAYVVSKIYQKRNNGDILSVKQVTVMSLYLFINYEILGALLLGLVFYIFSLYSIQIPGFTYASAAQQVLVTVAFSTVVTWVAFLRASERGRRKLKKLQQKQQS